MSSQTYPASCHCGSIAYTVTITPPLSSPDREVYECNCSICARNGYLFVYAKHEDVVFTAGEDTMTKYTFGEQRVAHFFCPRCGSSLYAQNFEPGFKPMDVKAVNVRQFHGLDLTMLKRRAVDGKST